MRLFKRHRQPRKLRYKGYASTPGLGWLFVDDDARIAVVVNPLDNPGTSVRNAPEQVFRRVREMVRWPDGQPYDFYVVASTSDKDTGTYQIHVTPQGTRRRYVESMTDAPGIVQHAREWLKALPAHTPWIFPVEESLAYQMKRQAL